MDYKAKLSVTSAYEKKEARELPLADIAKMV